jgi:cation:H+ antiporter
VRHPELLHDISALVIGANIGSDIFQQNFLIGLIGVVGVIFVHRKRLLNDVGGLIAAAVLLLIFSANGIISRIEGFALVALYIAYLVILKKFDLVDRDAEEIVETGKNHVLKNSIKVIASFTVMAFAAHFLLENSEVLVQATPLSASFFGVILLGVAAAFPEMTTSLIAVFKKKAKISAGILIGSNITNPMFAAGLGALISTYTVPRVSIVYDLPFKIATAFLIFWMLKDGKLKKWEAAVLIALYVAYLVIRHLYFPTDVFAI